MSLISPTQPSKRRRLLRGFTVFVVTTALLLPSLIISPSAVAHAKAAPASAPPPVAAPPEPFLINSPDSGLGITPATLAASLVSQSQSWSEKLTATVSSVLAFVAPSLKKANANPVEPLSPPPPPAPLPPLAVGANYDFDGDGKADIGRWHSTNTELGTIGQGKIRD